MYDAGRHDTTQTVAYTGTAAASTNSFGVQAYQIRVVASSWCHIAIGTTPVATVANAILPPNWIEYITVTPGQKISAIKAATAGVIIATDGSLWVTELV